MKKVTAFLALALLSVALLSGTPSEAEAQPVVQVCEAATRCPNGRTIWCRVYGSSNGQAACTWRVDPGRSVQCRGYINDPYLGWMWQEYYFTCGY